MTVDELRRQRRMAMRGVPERLGLSFAGGGIEMRAKPNGTAAGTNFEWRGYATVYNANFPMWDQNGDPYTESVAPGACKKSLANPALDVPFLVGHNDAGIPLARTKSGTMQLAEDSRGLHVHVPAMDGRREEVRALASAVERGDMDEMSLAFVCLTPPEQQWDAAFEHRTIREMDLHRGDVCAVVHGANPATAGAAMTAVEQLSYRRPVAIGGPVLLGERRAAAMASCADLGHECCGGGRCGEMEHRCCEQAAEARRDWRPYELRADKYDTADRKRMAKAGQAMDDGSYPIADAEDLGDAIRAVGRGGADHDAIRKHIIARAKALGLSSQIPDNWGADGSLQRAAGMPLESRASAADDMTLAVAPDYDAAAAPHDSPVTGTHAHEHSDYAGGMHTHEHDHQGDADHGHHGAGTSATVMVDASTGIPGEETQLAARRKLELMARELELEELAAAR